MAGAPRYKVYTAEGEYVAACKFAEDAAAVIASYEGGTIRDGHRRVVWREGAESDRAGNSYDVVAQTIYRRNGVRAETDAEQWDGLRGDCSEPLGEDTRE